MSDTVPVPDTVRDPAPAPLVSFPVRTACELRTALAARNLSQLRLAALTGCDPRTVRRWVDTRPLTKDRHLPRPIQALIHVTLAIYDRDRANQPDEPNNSLGEDAPEIGPHLPPASSSPHQ